MKTGETKGRNPLNTWDRQILSGFYQNILRREMLPFWLPRCLDREHGGFFTCFDNGGKTLVSHDKYTWSQGRFVWIWAKLADMDIFTPQERQGFLGLAKNGVDFLARHCLLGQHMNPGHTLEDMWFLLDAMEILEDRTMLPAIARIAQKAFRLGWDPQWGGLYHFVGVNGWQPSGQDGEEEEPTVQLVRSDWGSKLWWVHAEALYTSLRLYLETGDRAFRETHRAVGEYTFRVFPNPDPEIREWIQIRDRMGRPMDKVVALPVKDPYHIIRSLILMIEALEWR